MRYIAFLVFAGFHVLFLGGCAGIDYKPYPFPTTEPTAGTDVGGLVYYDDSPYLIVWPDGKGNVLWQLQYLPDQTKKRIACPYNYVASLNATLNFNNGVITQSSVAVDETEILKAVSTAATSLAPLLALELTNPPPLPVHPVPPPVVHPATVWIFKITLHKTPGNARYAQFSNAKWTVEVPIQMQRNRE